MTRITDAFKKQGKLFIPFITAGDPDLDTTEKLIYAMEEAGAGLIEIGIPFSDPTAEGPVILEADTRALAAGTKIKDIFAMLARVREKTQIPMVFLTYVSPVSRWRSPGATPSARCEPHLHLRKREILPAVPGCENRWGHRT